MKRLVLFLTLACLLPAGLASAERSQPGTQKQLSPAELKFRLAAGGVGFDSMAVLPNGKLYATIGSQYIRATLPSLDIDAGYPRPIKGGWGPLPASFNQGFDAMAVLPNGSLYVTKGNQYVKYADAAGTKIAPGYPKPIKGNWGKLPESFNQGFDTMAVLPNGKLYVTKGGMYVKYNDATGDEVAPGYPKPIKGNWGKLPESFNQGFDAMEVFNDGLTYVTKGNWYLRYSDSTAETVDAGYPKAIN